MPLPPPGFQQKSTTSRQPQKQQEKPIRLQYRQLNTKQRIFKMRDNLEHYSWDLCVRARVNFMKKVGLWYGGELWATALIALFGYLLMPKGRAMEDHGVLIYWLARMLCVASLILLITSARAAKIYPLYMTLLLVYTLSQSYLLSRICSAYSSTSIALCLLSTLLLLIFLSLMASRTSLDLIHYTRSLSSYAFDAAWVFIFVLFFHGCEFGEDGVWKGLGKGIAGLVMAFYSWFFVVDVQSILGGRSKELAFDHHVFGALLLYVDTLGIFLKILEIFGDKVPQVSGGSL